MYTYKYMHSLNTLHGLHSCAAKADSAQRPAHFMETCLPLCLARPPLWVRARICQSGLVQSAKLCTLLIKDHHIIGAINQSCINKRKADTFLFFARWAPSRSVVTFGMAFLTRPAERKHKGDRSTTPRHPTSVTNQTSATIIITMLTTR